MNSRDSTLSVLLNDDAGAFEMPTIYTIGAGLTAVVVADLDNDARLDIAVDARLQDVVVADFNGDRDLDMAVVNSEIATIELSLGVGNGAFHKQVIHKSDVNSHPVSLTMVDLNEDEEMGIAAANDKTNSLDLLLGNGYGMFTSQDRGSFESLS